MPSFFSNRRLIILLVCIIILVGLIGYSMSENRSVTAPEQFINDSVSWVQSIFAKPAHFVAGFFENLEEMKNLYKENQILKSHLDEYAALQVEVNDLRKQNEELKGALEVRDNFYDYTVRAAMIIHRSPDRWNEFIGINKGAQDGIEENMAVMTSKGLIGKVHEVSQFSATIQLLTDQDRTNRISAVVEGDETIYGFIEGIDEETGYLNFTKIDIDAEIEEGQLVVTSGLGGIFPKGLPIGEIVAYDTDEFGLTQTAYVKPSADFSRLDYVLIIERETPTLDEEINPDVEEEE